MTTECLLLPDNACAYINAIKLAQTAGKSLINSSRRLPTVLQGGCRGKNRTWDQFRPRSEFILGRKKVRRRRISCVDSTTPITSPLHCLQRGQTREPSHYPSVCQAYPQTRRQMSTGHTRLCPAQDNCAINIIKVSRKAIKEKTKL